MDFSKTVSDPLAPLTPVVTPPSVNKGEVFFSDMAGVILLSHSFLTLRETKQILCYHPNCGIYRYGGETVIEEDTQKWLENTGLASKGTKNYVNQVVGMIQRKTYIDRAELNPYQDTLVMKNGVLDLNTGTLSPHDKKYRSTVSIPVTFSPEATCPHIDKFISEIVAYKHIPLMYEIPAWCLQPYSKIQRIVLMLGGGANGKTTFMEMLTQFLGRENCKAHSMQALVSNRFAMAGLFGKLANIHDDLSSTALKQTSALKMLSGGSMVESEKKFQESFSFVNTAKLIFTTNQPPEIDEDTLAIWRRFVVIDFPFEFSGKADDKRLLLKITTEQELSGFMNKVLEGLQRLKKHGDFTYAASVEDTRYKYLLNSNPPSAFIETCCEFSPSAVITKEALYQEYVKFCERMELPLISKKAFGRKIKNLYTLQEQRVSWIGIAMEGTSEGLC